MSAATVVPVKYIPCLIQLAHTHPSTEIRARLRVDLDEWTDSLRPTLTLAEAKAVIAREEGTLFEPFALDPPHLDIAATAARVALSEALGGGSFRVVSQRTIGNRGGHEIGPGGRTAAYRERYVHGKLGVEDESVFFYAATLEPPADSIMATLLPATDGELRVSDKGLSLVIPASQPLVAEWRKDNAVLGKLVASSLLLSGTGTSKPDLAYAFEGEALVASARTPEAMIRFMTACISESILELSADPQTGQRLRVRLTSPASPRALRVRYLVDLPPRQIDDWMVLPTYGVSGLPELRTSGLPGLEYDTSEE